MLSTLSIDHLRLPVCIGTTSEEQQHPQVIDIQLCLAFKTLPNACSSDQLEDTIAYDVLVSFIKTHVQSKTYTLIEALAYDLHQAILGYIPEQQRFWLCVRKFPPLTDIGSCTFSIGDGHPHTWSS